MTDATGAGVLRQARDQFAEIAEREDLLHLHVTVLAKILTPEEAIGEPGRRDFPIIIGKERMVEANVNGARGHAFTDAPREFLGTLGEVLSLDLKSNQNRAIFVATLNAALGSLGRVDKTVHCKDEDPEDCAVEIATVLLKRYGRVKVGLIGLNPAIAERLAGTFGPAHVLITDLSQDNIGKRRFGVEILDGRDRTDFLIDASDVVVFTGSTLVNGTFDGIWDRIREKNKAYAVYGVTVSGVCSLLGIEQVCPRGRFPQAV